MTNLEALANDPLTLERMLVENLAGTAGDLLELQAYLQAENTARFDQIISGAFEVKFEITLSVAGTATLRLVGVDPSGTEEMIRTWESVKRPK